MRTRCVQDKGDGATRSLWRHSGVAQRRRCWGEGNTQKRESRELVGFDEESFVLDWGWARDTCLIFCLLSFFLSLCPILRVACAILLFVCVSLCMCSLLPCHISLLCFKITYLYYDMGFLSFFHFSFMFSPLFSFERSRKPRLSASHNLRRGGERERETGNGRAGLFKP